jgi:DNA transformation protein
MANSRDFIDHVLEMMRGAGTPSARAMFGGHGVYLDALIVGIVDDDVLYLKTDDATRAAFVALELPPFRYRAHDGEIHETAYLRAPDEALESPPAMREWLRGALAASLRAKAAKAPKRRRVATADTAPRTRSAKRPVAKIKR